MRLIYDLRESFQDLLKRLRWGALVPIVALLMIAIGGCGGGAPHASLRAHVRPTSKTALTAALSANCPVGQSYMGCSIGAARHPGHALHGAIDVRGVAPANGCTIPDVSSWQGHEDWAAAAPYICAAVAKAGEGGVREDPDFAWNVAQLRSLHIHWGAYFFVRGCSDGAQFVAELNSVGFKGDPDALRPDLDTEVPSAKDCIVPAADAIHAAFGIWPNDYSAPGTYPGGPCGGLDKWEADYTLGLREIENDCGLVIAWQRYSPPYTFKSVPGLGTIDESIDLAGFSSQLAFPPAPPKPSPFLIYPLKPILLYHQAVSERRTVERWWSRGCTNPVIRKVCVVTRIHLGWFAGRLYTLAHAGKDNGDFNLPPDWSPNSWGKRYHRIERILHG